MKRLALVAAVLVLAACTSKKDEAATADTSAPAMAPAPVERYICFPRASHNGPDAYPVSSAAYNILWVVGGCRLERPSSDWKAAIGVRRRLNRNTDSST